MSTTPNYPGLKRNASVVLNNASGTTKSTGVLTGGTNGTAVREIRVASGGSAAPGSGVKLAIWVSDGSVDSLIDVVTLQNVQNIRQIILRYEFLTIQSGWTLKFNVSTTLASGAELTMYISGQDY